MLKWLVSQLTAPVFGAALDGWKAKLAADSDHSRMAADLATRELDVQQREIEANALLRKAEIGHYWEPDKLFAYIVVFYFAKVVIWDVVFGLGVTDPLRGDAKVWAGAIVSVYTVRRGFENVARIWRG